MRRDGVNLLAIAADVVEQLDYLGRRVFVVVVVAVSELRVLLVNLINVVAKLRIPKERARASLLHFLPLSL